VQILTGDIGGSNSRLAVIDYTDGRLEMLCAHTFPSPEHASLVEIVTAFLAAWPDARPEAAAFGVAGPVVNGVCQLTNLPWVVSAALVAEHLKLPRTYVLNDLEALAWGIDTLRPEQIATLQRGDEQACGNRAVIAAGTGLGQAGAYFDGRSHLPFATEGGHADFAPVTEREWRLQGFLQQKAGHVSWERVVSGPGLVDLFEFLLQDTGSAEPEWLADRDEDGAAVISQLALDGRDPLCVEALEWFVSLYGAEAGNLALKMNARGGLYLGGGIAPKILPALERGSFMESFLDKGRMRAVVEAMPVRVILNPAITLQGLARFGALAAA
jgi:glucokinase